MLTVVADPEVTPATPASSVSLIDDIVRDGARRMLAAALEAEVAAYIDAHADEHEQAQLLFVQAMVTWMPSAHRYT